MITRTISLVLITVLRRAKGVHRTYLGTVRNVTAEQFGMYGLQRHARLGRSIRNMRGTVTTNGQNTSDIRRIRVVTQTKINSRHSDAAPADHAIRLNGHAF